jgi:hypothetical protein
MIKTRSHCDDIGVGNDNIAFQANNRADEGNVLRANLRAEVRVALIA